MSSAGERLEWSSRRQEKILTNKAVREKQKISEIHLKPNREQPLKLSIMVICYVRSTYKIMHHYKITFGVILLICLWNLYLNKDSPDIAIHTCVYVLISELVL